jgi:siroheme synthase
MEAFAALDAERHYVGKRGLQKSFKQTQIDALLVELCTQVLSEQSSCTPWSA